MGRVQPGGINRVRFRFAVLTYVTPRKIKIKYILEGRDREWRDFDSFSERQVSYDNMTPGQYVFRVIAANSSGVWNQKGVSFPFRLELFFYQTFLFKIIVGILAAAVIFGTYTGIKHLVYHRKLKSKYKNSPLDPKKAEAVLKRLRAVMVEKKRYRDAALTLNDLAEELNITPRHLSQVINEQLDKNFRDMVNGYRIEEAKELLLTSRQSGEDSLSIREISDMTGFRSKEVFYRVFRKYAHTTPREFLKNGGG